MIRDSALRASGLLSERVGGPSVFPPQPAGVTTEGTYGGLDWKVSPGGDRYRRGLYTFTKRTAPFAMATTFDAPSGEVCVARREVSNTPLQALTLLNDPVFEEAAQALGRLMAARAGSGGRASRCPVPALPHPAPDRDEVSQLAAFLPGAETAVRAQGARRRQDRRCRRGRGRRARRLDRPGAGASQSRRGRHEGVNHDSTNESPDESVTRRHFFRECGIGVGKIALAGLLDRRVHRQLVRLARRHRPESAGAEIAALRTEGEARHPPVHGRCAEPARPVRLQAGADQARRQAAAALGHRRPALCVHPPRRGRARAAVQVRQARPVRRGALGDAAAPGQGRRRHLPSSSRSTPTSSTTPRPRSSSTPASRSRAGPASVRG